MASSNIANADTTGYTVKTANQVSTTNVGVGTGVTITGITSTVDKLLLRALVTANSELGAANIGNNYLDRLQHSMEAPTGADDTGTSLANTLASLEAAVTSLAATPGSASLQSNVVSALDDSRPSCGKPRTASRSSAARPMRHFFRCRHVNGTEDHRRSERRDQAAGRAGQSTGDLEDQRNAALQSVATRMNVSYFAASNGDMQVYTASGQSLVDSMRPPAQLTPRRRRLASTSAYIPVRRAG